jgi:hypothetical protein
VLKFVTKNLIAVFNPRSLRAGYRLPREAMFVALPREVDTMLPRAAERRLPCANLARVEPNWSGSLSRGKGISVCCALSGETVLCRRNSVDQQPHASAALRCWTRVRLLTHKQTNEFVARGSRAQSIPGFIHTQAGTHASTGARIWN